MMFRWSILTKCVLHVKSQKTYFNILKTFKLLSLNTISWCTLMSNQYHMRGMNYETNTPHASHVTCSFVQILLVIVMFYSLRHQKTVPVNSISMQLVTIVLIFIIVYIIILPQYPYTSGSCRERVYAYRRCKKDDILKKDGDICAKICIFL